MIWKFIWNKDKQAIYMMVIAYSSIQYLFKSLEGSTSYCILIVTHIYFEIYLYFLYESA